MEDKVLELCKKVIGGETPHDSCTKIGCSECLFGDEKIDCGKYSMAVYKIARNYIKEHEKTVNTIEKIEEKHKYKIGDKVRVRSDLKSDTWYNSVLVNCTMAESRNEILTIEKIVGNKEYRVEENQWLWGEDMFEPVEETVTLKELKEIKKDNIIPTYYHRGSYDVIQFCNDNEIEFTTGNIIKYITRYKGKNGIEDLKKAKEYIRRSNGMEYEISLAKLIRFNLENNLDYVQGKIIECVIENNLDYANILIDVLIKDEEKKIKEMEETYQTEGMED